MNDANSVFAREDELAAKHARRAAAAYARPVTDRFAQEFSGRYDISSEKLSVALVRYGELFPAVQSGKPSPEQKAEFLALAGRFPAAIKACWDSIGDGTTKIRAAVKNQVDETTAPSPGRRETDGLTGKNPAA